MTRVLVASGAAGGATALAPVAEALRTRGVEVDVRASGPALAGFERLGVVASALEPEAPAAGLDPEPDALAVALVGPQSGLDHALRRAARARGIPVVGVIDSWTHLEGRVRDGDGALCVPDRVCAIDAPMRDALLGIGIAQPRVVVTGHPFAARLRAWPAPSRARAREALGVRSSERLAVFVSEPSTDPDGGDPEERRIATHLCEELSGLAGWRLAVREHPLRATLDPSALERAGCLRADALDPVDLLCAADAVVGLSSTLLVWAALLGRPSVSLARSCGVPVPVLGCAEWRDWIAAPSAPPAAELRERVGWDAAPDQRVVDCLLELARCAA